MPAIRPYSRRLAKVDKRTREGKLFEAIKQGLLQHVGPNPGIPKLMLVDRAAMLSLRIELIDKAALETGGRMEDWQGRQYLAWANALNRTLRELGLDGPPPKAPSLADYLGGRAA